MRPVLLILLVSFISLTGKMDMTEKDAPALAFSFDDGNPNDILTYKGEEWNNRIVQTLKKYKIDAVWFVEAKNMNNNKGKLLLKNWDRSGNLIANHTFTHLNYDDEKVSIERYENEILSCDSFIHTYINYRKLFRFPYLKAGNSERKRDGILSFLKNINYNQGWVTIDNSDWYINSRMIRSLQQNPKRNIEDYKKYYLEHIYDRAVYYNTLSEEINQREIKHTLLLHFNLTTALFLEDLIKMFKARGWRIENYSSAIKDPIYNFQPSSLPNEQSLIWMQAKELGSFDKVLRYPGEDGDFEKEKMEKAGL